MAFTCYTDYGTITIFETKEKADRHVAFGSVVELRPEDHVRNIPSKGVNFTKADKSYPALSAALDNY